MQKQMEWMFRRSDHPDTNTETTIPWNQEINTATLPFATENGEMLNIYPSMHRSATGRSGSTRTPVPLQPLKSTTTTPAPARLPLSPRFTRVSGSHHALHRISTSSVSFIFDIFITGGKSSTRQQISLSILLLTPSSSSSSGSDSPPKSSSTPHPSF
jgi:hypothetical protein